MKRTAMFLLFGVGLLGCASLPPNEQIVQEGFFTEEFEAVNEIGMLQSVPENALEFEIYMEAFGDCIGEQQQFAVLYRSDPYVGDINIATGPKGNGQSATIHSDWCEESFAVHDITSEYQLANPPTPAQEQAIVDEFLLCAATAESHPQGLDTIASVVEFGDQQNSREVQKCAMGVHGEWHYFGGATIEDVEKAFG